MSCKVVILAGGMGLRLFEETISTPKPMVQIDGKPILWYVMSRFAHFGFTEFVICLGYKPEVIKNYFTSLEHISKSEDNGCLSLTLSNNWKIELVDTGADTMTAGRIKRVKAFVGDDFLISYSDNLSDINVKELFEFHSAKNKLCTLTVIHPRSNYGVVKVENNNVTGFEEKPVLDSILINAGYFVCKKEIMEMISGDTSVLEEELMKKLVAENQLGAYTHSGFWQSVDTFKDLLEVRKLEITKIISYE